MANSNSSNVTELYKTEQFDLRQLYYLLRERAWVICLCLLLAVLGAATWLVRAPKIYASKVVLQVEQSEQKILNIQGVSQEHLQSQEILKTIEQTLQSRSLLQRVVETNKLAEDPRFVSSEEPTKPSKEQVISRLDSSVSAKLRRGTRLIDITVEHTDPQLTEVIANSIVREYMAQNFEYSTTTSKDATSFLKKEEEQLKAKLEKSEQALQAYREETKSISLEEQQSVLVTRIKELSAKVTEAKSVRITQEAAYQQIQEAGTNMTKLLGIPAVANDLVVKDLQAQIAKQESEIATLKQRYREKHPKYIQAHSQFAEWKKAHEKAVLSISQTVRSTLENAKASETALDRAMREQEKVALDLDKKAIRYNVLAREVEADRALYASVLNRIRETTVTEKINPNKVRIVQAATVPERPVKPNKLKTLAVGILAGLAWGVLCALLLNTLDQSIKSVDQAEELLGLPVLSAVPRFKGLAKNQRRIIMKDSADSPEAEAFRTLRTAVSMLGRKEDRRTFLFTSALPQEGKTFCSLNFSASLAQQGLRTVIIDCDLRRPMVETTIVGARKHALGVTDYITGQQNFQSIVHPTDTENLSYIPAGTHAPNPAELLAQTGIDGLIDEALLHFDRVVVDSAPIHAVSDTLLVLNRIRTLCLVVRVRRTPRKAVQRAVQLLREAEAPMAGVILNLLPTKRGRGYYYSYDSYYDYTYHGEYGQKTGKSKGKSKSKSKDNDKACAA